MECHVINVKSAIKRMQFMAAQLNRLGVKYYRQDAITTKSLDIEENDPYWCRWERPIKPSERACLLSHIKAWKLVIDKNIPILILEDDAFLVSDLNDVLNAATDLNDIDYLTLEVRNRKKLLSKRAITLNSKYKIRKLYQDRSGAAAYILWPSGAKKLLKRSKKYAALSDAMICMSYELSGFQIEPACAVQLDSAENYGLVVPISPASIIHSGKYKGRTDLAQYNNINYKLQRIKSQIRMGFRYLFNIFNAKKRYVEFDIQNFL